MPSGSAQQFIDFYWECFYGNDEKAQLLAHPDHFIYRVAPDSRHEVLETTGGSPLAGHFFLDYHDTSSLVTPIDPAFLGQIAAVARVGDTTIGGARHQFRDTATGFHARLLVEFPLLSLGRMISSHRWHLAAEFANWMEASICQGPSATERTDRNPGGPAHGSSK